MENSPQFFLSPKQDGTFSYDEHMDAGAAGGRYGFMRYDSAAERFLVNVYQETDENGAVHYYEYRAPTATHYMAVNREISREVFDEMWREQQQKPNLMFYAYTMENLQRFLTH